MGKDRWLTYAETKRGKDLVDALSEANAKARNYFERYKDIGPSLEADKLARIIATTLSVTARAFDRYAIAIDRKALGLPEAQEKPDVKG